MPVTNTNGIITHLGYGNQIFDEEQIGTTPVPFAVIDGRAKQKHLVAFRVCGDSMQPVINDDGIAVVDTSQTEIIDNKIYAFTVDDDYQLTLPMDKSRGFLLQHAISTNQRYH